MTASIKLSLLFFVSPSALADDAVQVETQAVVIQEQVEQAEKLEENLAEILRLIEERKAAEEEEARRAATPAPEAAPEE